MFYNVHLAASLCTVDFEMPNFFAVSRTVAFVVIMNFATSTARSSIYVFKPSTPLSIAWLCICYGWAGYVPILCIKQHVYTDA